MADSLTLTSIVKECAVPGFFAGILGNLCASVIEWAAIKGHGDLKDTLLKGADSALKNHDLVRAVVRAQMESATQVIDIALLEDYGAEISAKKNWLVNLSYLSPSKALRDHSNAEIKSLWELRTKLDVQLKELNNLTAAELDRDLVMDISNAQSIASPDISEGAENPYAEWTGIAAEAMCAVLKSFTSSSDIPAALRRRILGGEWIDLFRVSFWEELKRDKRAKTAYFINVHDTLATYAQQHARELGDVKVALEEGYNRHDEKLGELRNVLFSLRSHVKNLETASEAEGKKITLFLNSKEASWRKLVDEQKKNWQKAHAAHSAIQRSQRAFEKKLNEIKAQLDVLNNKMSELSSSHSAGSNTHVDFLLQEIIEIARKQDLVTKTAGDSIPVEDLWKKGTEHRRTGKLAEAEHALQALQEILAKDEGGKSKLALIEYELGYVNFLQAEVDLAIDHLRSSYTDALVGNDPVGAWIAKCIEYRAKWLFGRSSCDATLAVFRAARQKFSSYCVTSTKKLTAKRWVMNALLFQIEVNFETGDTLTARTILEECKVPPVSEGGPPLSDFLDHFEGLVALMEGSPDSVRSLEAVIDRKARSTTLADWHQMEAGAMDFYYLGLAYKRFGNLSKARDAWTNGNAFPASMGNQTWRSRCESELDSLDL